MKKLELNRIDLLTKSDYHQFYLGFLTQNNTYINRVWNVFINVTYKIDIGKLDFIANPYNWFYDTPLEIDGFVLENSWDVLKENYEKWLVDLIKSKIDKGKYIKASGDIYYIPFKAEYLKEHLQREIYIYGYDDNKLICLGFDKDGIVSENAIDINDFLLFIKKNKFIGDKYRCEVDFYGIKQDLFYQIEPETIKNELKNYLNASEHNDPPIGEHAMKKATEELFNRITFYNNGNFLLDYRDLMLKRLLILSKIKNLDKTIIEYEKIKTNWSKIIAGNTYANINVLFEREHNILNEIQHLL